MVLKQIKCPPTGKGYGMDKFLKKWLPGMELYAMDYIGVGDMIGTTKNKVARKVALGNNSFMSIGGTCGSSSDSECVGQERNMYLKSYPLGSIPTCIEKKDGTYATTQGVPLLGGTALIGGLQEDLFTLPITDISKSVVNRGVFASNDCMKARLPVGNGLLMGNRRVNSKEEAVDKKQAWWVEEKCIPRQPTVSKEYGGETFKIPFSTSYCVTEPFSNADAAGRRAGPAATHLLILSMILIFINIMRSGRP
uniref:Uncharacterized protein n=1 Tax=viral metagenome TaxID=1070528 RepID=A0A6C0AUV4_9ZZZZ|tara:strand:+ start:17893 stop:18645 length:753 start_codon:yes stop_codon:yes gene_type:complete